VPLFQVFQFDPQNRGLHGVEPPVVAAEKVLVFFLLPVVPQHFEALGNLAVIGDHDAAIAVSSQIFPGVKIWELTAMAASWSPMTARLPSASKCCGTTGRRKNTSTFSAATTGGSTPCKPRFCGSN